MDDDLGRKRIQVVVHSNCSKEEDSQRAVPRKSSPLLRTLNYRSSTDIFKRLNGLSAPCQVIVKVYAVASTRYLVGGNGGSATDPAFDEHVEEIRKTMFYICQSQCLCGTVNNRGKVIYCYGDLVPRHGELFAEGAESAGQTSNKDLLAAQLGVWTFGIIAL